MADAVRGMVCCCYQRIEDCDNGRQLRLGSVRVGYSQFYCLPKIEA